ncbi:hypothetical protein NM208_g11417 [Fusarium decemcellulare]|uniref:Uncharacterized protein n=1 Tax=Fusarium decemcellulare TaxID=57161 RepID=A0ACC1RUU7_9HYPO|nr:hypothetical protein NM208_g11417 [Fusarium decemcellulare]
MRPSSRPSTTDGSSALRKLGGSSRWRATATKPYRLPTLPVRSEQPIPLHNWPSSDTGAAVDLLHFVAWRGLQSIDQTKRGSDKDGHELVWQPSGHYSFSLGQLEDLEKNGDANPSRDQGLKRSAEGLLCWETPNGTQHLPRSRHKEVDAVEGTPIQQAPYLPGAPSWVPPQDDPAFRAQGIFSAAQVTQRAGSPTQPARSDLLAEQYGPKLRRAWESLMDRRIGSAWLSKTVMIVVVPVLTMPVTASHALAGAARTN